MNKLTFFTALTLIAASSAFSQVDTSSLRSRYGAPLNRETFMVRPGIEMVVDYGPYKQVCQMRFQVHLQGVETSPTLKKLEVEKAHAQVNTSSLSETERANLTRAIELSVAAKPPAVTKDELHQIVEELAASSIRGNEINRFISVTGGHSMDFGDFDKLTIKEASGNLTSVTITFKDSACPTMKDQ